MQNFHLPLPEPTYANLRAEADRERVPATALAREAIESWLRQRMRQARHDEIAAYAAQMSGTSLDLDTELESAGIEHLLETGRAKKADVCCEPVRIPGSLLKNAKNGVSRG
jgi:hypothetical protein